MNRIVAIYLIILYTAFTTGMAVDIHYCAGRISSVTFEKQNDKDGCGKCIKEKKGCCHDEVKFFKIDDAHSVAVVNDVPSTPIFTIAFNYFYQHDLLSNILENSILENHSPPSLSPPDIFTRNCVFRI